MELQFGADCDHAAIAGNLVEELLSNQHTMEYLPPTTRNFMPSAALLPADSLLEDLTKAPRTPGERAPTMGNIDKVRYSHVDMIDFIIAHPECSQKTLAARYGYAEGWVSNIMASDAWQSTMAARREEIVDPELRLSLEERFRGVTTRSLQRLMEKLDAPQVSDQVVLRAVELGAKALGVGGNAPPKPPDADHLARLAERLLVLQSNVRHQGVLINGQSEIVPEAG